MHKTLLLLSCLIASSLMFGQTAPDKKVYQTKRIQNIPPVIDGAIDDPAWATIEWEGDFTQYEPYQNVPPTFETRFKILFDDRNLYVAFHAYDPSPDSIVRRLSRRDDGQGDLVAIQFDSYYDLRTGFTFMVTAAGVKIDMIAVNDGQTEDATWDPVWAAKTSIVSDGWVAEMQIPFTQLRFADKANHIWGLQVARHLFRKKETSLWQFIPRNAPGWVHLIGEMHGLSNIAPKKQFDITPYGLAQAEKYEKIPANPFRTGASQMLNGGLDAKIGLTNNLTLDLSVNPDFGQVEADPSVVNLSAYETFFEEKRPFFIEGRNIMNFNLQPGDGDGAAENLFYSRRIGRRPQYNPGVGSGQFIKTPINTTIIGAAKLTGKTDRGVSIGIMESLTSREFAELDSDGLRSHKQVEPLTNYFAARVSKDFNKGNTIIGGMLTAVNRDLNDASLRFLHRAAYTGGGDFEYNWKDKTYTLRVRLVFSHVGGDSLALVRTQRSPARYYQRPDADHVSLDSTRTSLSGHGGAIELWKGGNSKLQFGGFIEWKSPGLELNDIGFVRSADEILQVGYLGYRETQPKGFVLSWRINANQWTVWDFSGKLRQPGGNFNANIQFKNYWSFGTGINMQGATWSSSALRGGPMLYLPAAINNWLNFGTDSRKKLRINAGWTIQKGASNHSFSRNIYAGLTYRPLPSVSFSLNPQYSESKNNLQFVSNLDTPLGKRYLNAKIDQQTLSLSLRANLNLTPDLSIQYWGQPFISTGKYSEFKYITEPGANKYANRFKTLSGNQVVFQSGSQQYQIDENRDGLTDYTIRNPDYKALAFLSNLVLRWEYRPGSTLFLVWSQGRNNYFTDGAFDLPGDARALFDIYPQNIFLIKLSYRIGLS